MRLAALIAIFCSSVALAPLALGATPIVHVRSELVFHTPDRAIQCSATFGAHGSGVNCGRVRKAGPTMTVAWFGTDRSNDGETSLVQGAALPYGTTRGFAFDDHHTFICASYRTAMRCWDARTHHGFLLGLHVATLF